MGRTGKKDASISLEKPNVRLATEVDGVMHIPNISGKMEQFHEKEFCKTAATLFEGFDWDSYCH